MSKPGKREMITRIDYVMREGATIAPLAYSAAKKRAIVYERTLREEIILHSCPTEFRISCPADCYKTYESCIECWLKYMFVPREGAKE